MHIELVKYRSGWFWRLKSRNNQILAHSEIYSSKSAAKKTIKSVLDEAIFDGWKEVKLKGGIRGEEKGKGSSSRKKT